MTTKIATRTYRKWTVPSVYLFRDQPDIDQSIQGNHFNNMSALFLRRFAKMYAAGGISQDERARIRRQLERVFDAYDALYPIEPEGGMYLRGADR